MAVQMITESIVDDRSITLPVSVFLDEFDGISDVCLGLPCVISRTGIKQRLRPELNEEEHALLQKSAVAVKKVIELTSQTQGPL